jgi:anti-sigma regulatory factor (Ser/Thr protein kinase)
VTVPLTVPVDRFEHEALFYRGDADFLAGLLPFVHEGLENDEAVLVAEPRPRLELLRDALGSDATAVEFLDMAEIGANPARIIGVWATALDRHTSAGRRLRGVGEPAFPGRRTAELVECRLHELLLNHAFDGGPGWRLLCPYDQEHLPRAVTQAALHTHPVHSTSATRLSSDAYAAGGHVAAFAEGLPEPADAVLRGVYGAGDIPATRRTVAQWARSCGLPEERVEVLELAASELATNSVRHGGGTGTLAMWLDNGAAVVQFSDTGTVTDPLTGRLSPPLDHLGGRGLYLINQLCDLVQVRSSDRGTTVRILTWF